MDLLTHQIWSSHFLKTLHQLLIVHRIKKKNHLTVAKALHDDLAPALQPDYIPHPTCSFSTSQLHRPVFRPWGSSRQRAFISGVPPAQPQAEAVTYCWLPFYPLFHVSLVHGALIFFFSSMKQQYALGRRAPAHEPWLFKVNHGKCSHFPSLVIGLGGAFDPVLGPEGKSIGGFWKRFLFLK